MFAKQTNAYWNIDDHGLEREPRKLEFFTAAAQSSVLNITNMNKPCSRFEKAPETGTIGNKGL